MIIIIIVTSIVKRGGKRIREMIQGESSGRVKRGLIFESGKTKSMKRGFVLMEKSCGCTMATKKPYTSRNPKNQWIFGMEYGCL